MNLVKTADGKFLLTLSRSEWEGAGRSAGWLKTAINWRNIDFDRDDATPGVNDEMPVELHDDQTETDTNIKLKIDFEVEATEYEGGHPFYAGGIVINNLTVAEPFVFRSRAYQAGQELPDEVAAHVSLCDSEEIPKVRQCLNEIATRFLERQGVKPKVRRHRAIR